MKKLLAIFAVIAMVAAVMPAAASAYWSQAWNESGAGNFDVMEAFVVSGSTFANTGLSGFSVAGWSGSKINSTYAYASGPATSNMNFVTEFSTASSAPLVMDFYAYLNGGVIDSARAIWNGSGFDFSTSPTGPYNRTPAVPIPAAIWLFGAGLVGLVGVRRRFKA